MNTPPKPMKGQMDVFECIEVAEKNLDGKSPDGTQHDRPVSPALPDQDRTGPYTQRCCVPSGDLPKNKPMTIKEIVARQLRHKE